MSEPYLPPIEQLARQVANGQRSLSQAQSLLEEHKREVGERLAELRGVWEDLIKNNESNLEFRHALLELAVAAAIAADSARDFLLFALNLGKLLATELRQVKRGVELMEESLQQLKVISLDRSDQARVVLDVADAYLTYGDRLGHALEVATEAYRVTLQLAEGTGDEVSVARGHLGLGTCLTEVDVEGEMIHADEGIEHYRQALEHLRADNHPHLYGVTQNNLGNAYLHRPTGERGENLRRAQAHLQQALTVRSRETNPSGYRITCGNLSEVYEELGKHHLAIEYQERVVSSLDPVHDRGEFGAAQGTLAKRYRNALHSALGRGMLDQAHCVSQALACYTAARESFSRETEPESWSRAVDGLASVLVTARNQTDRAIALFEEARCVLDPMAHRAQYALVGCDLVQTLCVRAREMHSKGNQAHAERDLDRALAIAAELDQSGELSEARRNLLRAEIAMARATATSDPGSRANLFRQAEELARQGLSLTTSGTDSSELGVFEGLLVDALVDQSRFVEAQDILNHRLDWKQFSDNLSLADVVGMSRAQEHLWDKAVHVSLAAGDELAALCYSDNARAQVLARLAGAAGRARLPYLPRRLLKRYRSLSEAWLEHHARSGSDPDEAERARQIAPWLEEVISEARRWRGHWGVQAKPLRWPERSAAALSFPDRQTALVEYWCGDDGAQAFVLFPNEVGTVLRVALPTGGKQRLLSWLFSWFEHYAQFERRPSLRVLRLLGNLLDRVCSWVYEAYWEPLLDVLTDRAVERVVVIPDSWMGVFPLHLGSCGSGTDRQYVCDRFEISFCPSLSFLHWARQREGPAHGPVLCFGNPITECPIGECSGECRHALPLAAQESDVIRANWPDVHQLLGEDCTEANILRLAADLRPGIVHAATHGKMDFEDPLGSGLLIRLDPEKAAAPQACYLDHELGFCWVDRAIGSVLTLDTIMREMKLEDCRLVVLSACEMGLNQVHVPRENLSVAAGFLAAGVPSVVAPLWPVVDVAARLLMDRFYSLLRQQPLQKAKALIEAQRWLRALPLNEAQLVVPERDLRSAAALSGSSEFPFRHALFWGPFQLIGSPR